MFSKNYLLFVIFACVFFLCSCIEFPVTVDPAIGGVEGDINELLDSYTNSRIDYGCDMELLIDGVASHRVFVDMIVGAEDHINIETLYFDDDSKYDWDAAMEIALLLVDKVRQGVEVSVIVDPLIQTFYSGNRVVDVLRAGGVSVLPYVTPDRRGGIEPLLFRTHKKLMIVDGERAVVGGMNFGYVYLAPDQWRDTNVLVTGPVVGTMQQEFLYDWRLLGGDVGEEDRYFPTLDATGDLGIRAVEHRPAENDFDVNNVILVALRSAQEYIDIEAPYFNPTDWLLDELLRASARGVRVRILTNSLESTDVQGTYYAAFFWFEVLLGGGVEIYLWGLPGRTMHSKAMTVDGRLAMVGSHNFNYRSIMWDTENAVVFTDSRPVGQIQDMIDADFGHEDAFQVDLDWLRAQPLDSLDLLLPMIGYGWLF